MLQRFKITVCFLFFVFCNKAQINLVPNPSFEDTLNCPVSSDEIYNAMGWSSPTAGTPDYFNTCHTSLNNAGVPNNFFGYQPAFGGNAYAGFGAYQPSNIREYIQVKLDSIMKAGVNYCVSYYLSLAEISGYSIKQIGLYFSSTLINNPITTTLPFIPQIENNSFISDTNLWVKVTGAYTAFGNEEYLIIGNFNNDSNTDTLSVSDNSNACYYYVDSIEVKACPQSSLEINHKDNIKISSNPVDNYFNIDFGNYPGPFTVELYNATGQLLCSLVNIKSKKIDVDTSGYNANLILIKVKSQNQNFFYKLLKN